MGTFRATLETLLQITGGRRHGPSDPGEHWVEAVSTDTRRAPRRPFVFVALRGPNFDGNRFAAAACDAGASVLVLEQPPAEPPAIPVILVDDGLAALQALAGWWRGHFEGQVVGITGSNGKTAVKEMAHAVLTGVHRVFRSPGSFNSQVGVALSLLRAPDDADVYLIECGVSRPGEMDRLQAIVRPDIGLLTNIGTAHLAGFGAPEVIAREKAQLFRAVPHAVIAHEVARAWAADLAPVTPLWVGAGRGADWLVEAGHGTATGFRFELSHPAGRVGPITVHSFAAHDVGNAALAAALAVRLGVGAGPIGEGLASYSPSPQRIEVHTSTTGSNITLINDSYSADPLSMDSALATLRRLAVGRRALAVLGGMADLGEESAARHRDVGERVARDGVTLLVTVGRGADEIAAGARSAGMAPEAVLSASDAADAARALEPHLEPDDVVLVKASRPNRLEHTAQDILEAMSPTRAYIDLEAIADNVRRLRAWMGSEVSLMAVVKSFGYGSDAVRVSELLQDQGADYLCVAYPDEGVLLRRRGISLPILVTSVVPSEADKVAKYGLSAVCFSDELADGLVLAAERHGRIINVHLKVDTGMGRFGLPPEHIPDFARRLDAAGGLRLEGVMSHLSVADDPAQDEYTRAQIDRFRSVVDQLTAMGLTPPYVHIANSAGLWRFPEAHFNAVRLGLGLYGALDCGSPALDAPELTPAISLHSRLVGIREIASGQSVGYGRTYTTGRATRIGLVGLGYNDGLPWSASNKAMLWVNQRRVPIVGNVCMDVTMVDLSDVPEARVGDDVIIYSGGDRGEPTVTELAAWAGTIPYEILCRIAPRVRRIVRLAP